MIQDKRALVRALFSIDKRKADDILKQGGAYANKKGKQQTFPEDTQSADIDRSEGFQG